MARGFGATLGAGTTDVVRTGLLSSGSDRRSYSVWFNRNGLGGGNFGNIFFKAPFSETFYFNNTGSFWHYDRCNAAGTQTARHNLGAVGTSGALTGVWNHCLLTHDQSAGLVSPIAYWNGIIQSSQATTSASVTTATNVDPYYIGNDSVASRVFDGQLAHFAVWDGVILGRAEALALFCGAHPATIAPGNLVCYLPLDGMHSPELDYVLANGPGLVTGTRAGTTQPFSAPVHIPLSDAPLYPGAFVDPATIAAARQYAVTVT